VYRLNLLPDELIQEHKKAFPVLLAVLAVLCVLVYCLFLYISGRTAAEIKLLEKKAAEMQQAATVLENLKSRRAELEKEASELESLAGRRVPIFPVIEEIGKNVPAGMRFTELKFYNEGGEYRPASGRQAAAADNGSYRVADETGKTDGGIQGTPGNMPPDAVVITGESRSVALVAVLVKKLSGAECFREVHVGDIRKNENNGLYDFSLTAFMYRGEN